MIAWSYSRLSTAERCLKMLRHHALLKDVTFKPSPAMDRGNDLHDRLKLAALRYYEHKMESNDPKTVHVMPIIKNFCSLYPSVYVEQQMAFTENLVLCDWFDKKTWLRAIFDIAGISGDVAAILDWKTGQVRYERDQLKLFALVAFMRWPEVRTTHTSMVFIDHKESTPVVTFTRQKDYDSLLQEFGERSEVLQIAERNGDWPATPGDWCGWQCQCNKRQCKHAR